MGIKHKTVTEVVNDSGRAQTLSAALNAEAGQGWRVQHASTGIYRRQSQYFADSHCIVLEETSARYEYVCVFVSRPLGLSSDAQKPSLNDVIKEQEDKGLSLVQLLQTAVINPDSDRGATKNSGHLLIFEKALTT